MNTKNFMFYCWIILIASFIGSCNNKPLKINYDERFEEYLSAHTAGLISKNSPIIVQFAQDIVVDRNMTITEDIFSIEPKVAGNLEWADKSTLRFVPKEKLASNTLYTISIKIQSLIDKLPKDLGNFQFQVQTKPQIFSIKNIEHIAHQKGDKSFYTLKGKVSTTDIAEIEEIEGLLTAKFDDKKYDIIWEHEDDLNHTFQIHEIKRNVSPYQLVLQSNPKAIFASNTIADIAVEIPSNNDFKLLNHYVYNTPSQYIRLSFSESLNELQDLQGLITLANEQLSFSIQGNQIDIYPKRALVGQYKLNIPAGIKALNQNVLSKGITLDITFENPKPSTEWLSKGNILPNGKSMPIIFKTINLNAIDVRVTKIKSNHVLQFFQVNTLNGNEQLKRVGTEIMRKKIALNKQDNFSANEWTTHSLDLASLLQTEAGAIYEIAIGFKKEYAAYTCEKALDESHIIAKDMLDRFKWDIPSNSWYDYEYYNDFDDYYEMSQNPCSYAYYNSDKVISKNVLASDLGIMVKRADNDNLFIINDLHTNAPISNVTLEIYDYHQDIIARGSTDALGMAKIPEANLTNEKAFFVIAKKDSQIGYLRIDKNTALSMSRFDISGTKYEKGLKGFIYGERGVWRPGDDILLTFILEDKSNTLPHNHPIQFELRDHKNKLVTKRTIQEHSNGFYDISTKTNIDAETGTYQAIVKIGSATFSKNIKIENIKPNRLKIDINATNNAINISNGKSTIHLVSSWLHGAPANGLKANVQLNFKNAIFPFPEYKNYKFQDAARNLSFEPTVIFEDNLDANGKANITINIEDEQEYMNAPGPLFAQLNTQVFETGGEFSVNQQNILAHPYSAYVGMRLPASSSSERTFLETDKNHTIDIVTLNTAGQILDKNLQVEIYKLSWAWWFSYEMNDIPAWNGKVNATLYTSKSISTKNGKATYALNIPSNHWGRYLVRVCDGSKHCTGEIVYMDWANWYDRATDGTDEGATALNINTSKSTYKAGETVTLNFPTSFNGRALVTLENDAKILKAEWIETKAGNTQYQFTATSDMTPNIYAYVTLLQPHSQTKNDLPIRMYGVKNINIEDPNTILKPIITVAENLKPLENFTVKVSEQKGSAMTYTLAVVDEGLLDITNFKTPNPWQNFYQHMALGVRTWDMYNEVIGAYGGVLKSLLSIGGDEAFLKDKVKTQDRFKPVVLFEKAITLKAGETKTHTFTMPNYVGSVRVMVVAAHKGAYGQAEKTAAVKQDLMALATLPRVIGPNEEFALPINIFVQNEQIKSINISIENDNIFEVLEGKNATLAINEKGEKTIFAKIKTKNEIGKGKLKVKVESGTHQAYYETDLIVRNANPIQSIVEDKIIEKGKTLTFNYNPIGIKGTNTGVIELSLLPAINLKKRMDYLLQYPYGCVEQITSGAFPQLFVHHITDMTEEEKNTAKKNIENTISKLNNYINTNGAFAYWTGMNYSYDWVNTYVTNFLLEAQKAGYAINNNMLEYALNNILQTAKNWSKPSTNIAIAYEMQAYNLYVLALANKADIAAMNRLRSHNIEKETAIGAWYLATAYAMAGQKSVAETLTQKAKKEVDKINVHQAPYAFTSTARNEAMLLQAFVNLGDNKSAKDLIPKIAQRLGSNDYLNTQETAFSIIALAKYVQNNNQEQMDIEYKIANGQWQKNNSNKVLFTLALTPEETQKIEVKNNNNAVPLYARLISQGSPIAGEEKDYKNGLVVQVSYLQDNKTFAINKIKQSENFVAKITVQNTSAYNLSEVAMT